MRHPAVVVVTSLLVLFSAAPRAAAADADQATKTYLLNAAMCDLFAIETGRLAQERSQTPALREMARQLTEDYVQAAVKRAELIGKLQLDAVMPKTLDKERRHQVEELRQVEDGRFDREYLSMQIEAHETPLSLHRAYVNAGPDEPVRAVAANAAATVERQLAALRKVRDLPPRGA